MHLFGVWTCVCFLIYNLPMTERDRYIDILEKASEAFLNADRAETARRIDRRIFSAAASGAIRAGVPVRVSDDGLFLTIDLGGRSYTVVASAVEAILREDYDRSLSVCRFMASEAYEGSDTEPDQLFAETERKQAVPWIPEKEKSAGPVIFCKDDPFAGRNTPRFESRTAGKETVISLPEDRGEGGVPEDLPRAKRGFRPAGEKKQQITKRVTVHCRENGSQRKMYLFLAEPLDLPDDGPFAVFFLTVRESGTEKILYQGTCTGKTEFSADGTGLCVIGIRKDGGFHLGVTLCGASAGTCIMDINDE